MSSVRAQWPNDLLSVCAQFLEKKNPERAIESRTDCRGRASAEWGGRQREGLGEEKQENDRAAAEVEWRREEWRERNSLFLPMSVELSEEGATPWVELPEPCLAQGFASFFKVQWAIFHSGGVPVG